MSLKRIKAAGAVLPDGEILKPAILDIQDGHFIRVSNSLPDDGTPTLDLSNQLLFPGFTNAHCHLELSDLPPIPQTEFVPWIEKLLVEKSKLDDSHWNQSVQKGLAQLQDSGVTTVLDHISFNIPLQSYEKSSLRIIGFHEVLGTGTELATLTFNAAQKRQKECDFSSYPTPHGLYSLKADILQELSQQKEHFSIHLQESPEEVSFFKNRKGPLWDFMASKNTDSNPFSPPRVSSGIKYADQLGSLSHSLVIHANHLTDQDLDLLQKTPHTCVVHCPGSFAFFNHQGFDLKSLQDRGIPVALGTDSAASNEKLNFLHEIQLFVKRFPDLDLKTLLPMLTTNALKPLGRSQIGQISEGFTADLCGFTWDGQTPAMELLCQRHKVDFIHQS